MGDVSKSAAVIVVVVLAALLLNKACDVSRDIALKQKRHVKPPVGTYWGPATQPVSGNA